jgi:hypothetical protein
MHCWPTWPCFLLVFGLGSVFPRNSPTLEAETVVISGKSKGIMNSLTKKIGNEKKKEIKIEKKEGKERKKNFLP